LEALITDPERRRAMGAAGRRWVETHYSLDVTGPAWAAALGLRDARRAERTLEAAVGPALGKVYSRVNIEIPAIDRHRFRLMVKHRAGASLTPVGR
jgi:hypothetical protein